MNFIRAVPVETWEPPDRLKGMEDGKAYNRYCLLHRIQAECQARRVRDDGEQLEWLDVGEEPRGGAWCWVDMTSANIAVQVIEALKPENRKKILGLPIPSICQMAMRVAQPR